MTDVAAATTAVRGTRAPTTTMTVAAARAATTTTKQPCSCS